MFFGMPPQGKTQTKQKSDNPEAIAFSVEPDGQCSNQLMNDLDEIQHFKNLSTQEGLFNLH